MSQLTQPFSSRNAILAFITRPLAPPPPPPAGARLRCPQAAAMSRAMAMTALIDKLTSRPFVYFEMFHPIPRERRRQRLTRYGNAVVSGCGARALAAGPRTGSAPGGPSATPLRITRAARFCTTLRSSPCCSAFAIRLNCDAASATRAPSGHRRGGRATIGYHG